MKRIVTVSLALLIVLGMLGSAVAGNYVGAAKCKMCHQIQYKSWSETKHAKAFEALKGAEQSDPKCVKCHVTNSAANPGVQCEACHGAGSDYMKMAIMKNRDEAVKAGMVVPTEATCKGCHNPEAGAQFKGFNFGEAVKKVHEHKAK